MLVSHKIVLSLSLGAVVLVGPSAGLAMAEAPAAADPALQEAKAAFEEAQALYTKEQFGEAAAKFMAAFDKKPFSSFLFNAAVAYEKAMQLEKAVDTFQEYLRVDPQARDAVDVKARIDALKAVLTPPPVVSGKPAPEKAPAQVLPAIVTKGLVIIESKPAGANVYLDDTAKGVFATTPWQGSLEPKPVRLIFEAKGFKRETREINPRSDKILELYISMSEEHFLGWIEVVSNVPGADVFIDRLEIGAIGQYALHRPPQAGQTHPVGAADRVRDATKDIDVEPGTATTHTLNLDVVSYGTLKAGSKATEGGKLFVDGAQVCVLPCEQQLKPGDHVLRCRRKAWRTTAARLTVNRADITVMDVNYSPKPSRVKAWTEAVSSAALFGGWHRPRREGQPDQGRDHKDIKDPSKIVNSSDSRKNTGKYYYIGADVCLGLGAGHRRPGRPGTSSNQAHPARPPSRPPTGSAQRRTSSVSHPRSCPGGAGLAATGRF